MKTLENVPEMKTAPMTPVIEKNYPGSMDELWKSCMNYLCEDLSKVSGVRRISINASGLDFSHDVYCTVDFLDKKDWPNGIFQNSIYVEFEIDFKTYKVGLQYGSSVWLSEKDKEPGSRYSMMAKRGITSLVPKFRKKSFIDRSGNDILPKIICDYVTELVKALNEYTGGYPYKNEE
jgi:hypothetical protein